MKGYKDLEVYKLAYDLALTVHEMTLKLPSYELYEEGSQARRSSKGIAACIAEGYGRRRYKAEFIRFLIYAQASCDETTVHLSFLKDSHNLDDVDHLLNSYRGLGSKIGKFIQYVDQQWRSGVSESS